MLCKEYKTNTVKHVRDKLFSLNLVWVELEFKILEFHQTQIEFKMWLQKKKRIKFQVLTI